MFATWRHWQLLLEEGSGKEQVEVYEGDVSEENSVYSVIKDDGIVGIYYRRIPTYYRKKIPARLTKLWTTGSAERLKKL